VPQKAIIEFLCDKTRDGTDTEKDDRDVEDEDNQDSLFRREEDDDKKEKQKSLNFISYKTEKPKDEEWGILRLEWRTKYACESAVDEPLRDGSSWGFFTWFIIMYVLPLLQHRLQRLMFITASSSQSLRTSFSAPGLTTTDTAHVVGTFYRTATLFAISLT
jgi:hypothetical protein